MTTLVLGSGGIKGIAYTGLCKQLESTFTVGREITHIVGCSIGSVVGILLACGMRPADIMNEFLTTNFHDMLSTGSYPGMVRRVGIFDPATFMDYMETLVNRVLQVERAREITFEEFQSITGVALYTLAADTVKSTLREFGPDSTPTSYVLEGVVASCSIPFLIQARSDTDGSVLIDGAAIDPVGLSLARKVTPPGGTILCSFFSGWSVTTSLLGDDSDILQNLKPVWDAEVAPEHGATRGLREVVAHGQRILRCFTDSFIENYVARHTLENSLLPNPHRVVLIPLPNFRATLSASPEKKAQMYFTGADVARTILQKYLPQGD